MPDFFNTNQSHSSSFCLPKDPLGGCKWLSSAHGDNPPPVLKIARQLLPCDIGAAIRVARDDVFSLFSYYMGS